MTNTGKEESTTDGTRSSDVGDTPKTPKVHAKYNSEDSDVTIVSSDGVEFKVHSYRMQAASFVFRDLLSLPQPSNERSPISFTDPLIEHSWVLESLLDSVYELEVTCLNDYLKARAVIDLAEKWCFTHVIKLIRYHFRNGKCEGTGLSMQRFALALALKDEEQVNACLTTWHASRWGGSPDKVNRPGQVPSLNKVSCLYLYEQPLSKLLTHGTITGGDVFDFGTWSYREFLQIPPTAIRAILRARQQSTISKSTIDGTAFQEKFAKLLKIIMADDTAKLKK